MLIGVGQTLSHYRLLKKIGEGGMGEVYLAEDTSLKRRVALKLLPESMATNPEGLTRFRREAEAVAALNHPHIVTLYSIEEIGDLHFLTMEYVEGNSLANLIRPGGVEWPQLIEIACEIAEALCAAHERGIVHRDLKPANVMLTAEGRVKVLDFGLAKLGGRREEPLAASGPSAPTQRGPLTSADAIVGTVPYMAPEQLKHEPVDARTDLFAFGVLLYELAAGRRPFEGNSPAETVSAILRDTPPPIADSGRDVCQPFESIIEHCLRKDPSERYPSASALLADLRELRNRHDDGSSRPGRARRAVAAAVSIALLAIVVISLSQLRRPGTENSAPQTELASIAVLPFVNLGPEGEQDYFSYGLSEELLNSLAQIPALRVISRTSSFQFKGKNQDIRKIGALLGANNILEGSVRRSGRRIRITAQLIDATQGTHLWSQTFEKNLDDIFDVEDEISRAVVQSLRVTLLGDRFLDPPPQPNPEAYTLTLQGGYLAQRGTERDLDTVLDYYRRALAIDPKYAPAHVGLARTWIRLGDNGQRPVAQSYAEARAAANRALELDPNLAAAHAALGTIQMSFDWYWKAAGESFERASQLDPNNYVSHVAMLSFTSGRFEEAIELFRQALARDPLQPATTANLAFACYYAGHLEEARALARTVVDLNPGISRGHYRLGLIDLARGHPDSALAEFEQESSDIWRLAGLPLAYHALGRLAEADEKLAEFTKTFSNDSAYQMAEIYAYRGETDSAFKWLDRAYAERDTGLTQIKGNPLLKNLVRDPRFNAILVRLELAS